MKEKWYYLQYEMYIYVTSRAYDPRVIWPIFPLLIDIQKRKSPTDIRHFPLCLILIHTFYRETSFKNEWNDRKGNAARSRQWEAFGNKDYMIVKIGRDGQESSNNGWFRSIVVQARVSKQNHKMVWNDGRSAFSRFLSWIVRSSS